MKPTFHAAPVNNPFEDPAVFIRILRERRAMLFDLGYIARLGVRNILKLTDIFISHTHIDHFIGFDLVLRAVLRSDVPLTIYGPENIIDCVEGKLRGYTWNLVRDYPLRIEVCAITGDSVRHAGFYAESSFRRTIYPDTAFTGTLLQTPHFRVRGLLLSHQIPVMAYSLEEEFHININKALLSERELPVGPWLSLLKRLIRENAPDTSEIIVGERRFTLGELREIATITRGQKISYVTDIAPTDENIAKAIPFVQGSDTLFCEAFFLEQDRDRAEERHHLTAAITGKIAREAGVGNLELMHFSPKYKYNADDLYREAMKEFKGDRCARSSS